MFGPLIKQCGCNQPSPPWACTQKLDTIFEILRWNRFRVWWVLCPGRNPNWWHRNDEDLRQSLRHVWSGRHCGCAERRLWVVPWEAPLGPTPNCGAEHRFSQVLSCGRKGLAWLPLTLSSQLSHFFWRETLPAAGGWFPIRCGWIWEICREKVSRCVPVTPCQVWGQHRRWPWTVLNSFHGPGFCSIGIHRFGPNKYNSLAVNSLSYYPWSATVTPERVDIVGVKNNRFTPRYTKTRP